MVRPRTTRLTSISVVLAFVVIGGCGGRPPARKYEVLTGVVESLETNTGQLTLRSAGLRSTEHEDLKIPCLLSNDTEIYINDRWHNIKAVGIGDRVELIGYRESDPRGEHFVVSLANVTREMPPAPEPELPSPTPQPMTQTQESPAWTAPR